MKTKFDVYTFAKDSVRGIFFKKKKHLFSISLLERKKKLQKNIYQKHTVFPLQRTHNMQVDCANQHLNAIN